MRWPIVGWCALAATKGTLTVIIATAVFVPELREFSDRGVAGRAGASILALLILPAWWLLDGRHREIRYPYTIDALLPVPFIVDDLARAGGLDVHGWWGPLAHALNFAILAVVVTVVLARTSLDAFSAAVLCIATGAVGSILWELLEYVTLHRGEARGLYSSSMQDLAVALAATVVVAVAARAARRASGDRGR